MSEDGSEVDLSDASDGANRIELESHFVRHRNAMVARADFGPLYEDYYLHLMQAEIKLTRDQDELLKDALAALALHLFSHPAGLSAAWTLNFNDPPLNLFVTGDRDSGNVVGRVFTQDVKVGPSNLFYSQVASPRNPVRQSTIEFEGHDLFRIVEAYYVQSEQFPARLFRLGGDEAAMVTAHPDCDMDWYRGLNETLVANLAEDEELGFLERLPYHFGCGCRLITIVKVLTNTFGRDPEQVFAGKEDMSVVCPRCAGSFHLDRPTFAQALDLLDRTEKSEAEGPE
ncbi:MAG TPA: disulfide bond chaperone [Planctomycetes bacterium]|nr:disulfide bond chaperone [Planctomycetota bacterium]